MVTSAEFDEVLVPVDYQKDVLVRTFDTLIGFNKKNKKGKFMPAIKEEWVYDPVTKKSVFRDREAERKAFNEKKEKGAYKIVNLDAKKSKPAVTAATKKEKTPEEKAKGKELYKGYLLNKVGKTNAQIEKEIKDRNATPRGLKKERIEPGDTHYTCKEIADYVYNHSSKARQKWLSNLHLWDDLIANEKLRKFLDEKMIAKLGHKTEEEMKKSRKAVGDKKPKEKADLETDVSKIAEWFWKNRKDKSFKVLFPDVDSLATLSRMIRNDDRGTKFFAKIMKDHGYMKTVEKPFEKKAVIIKKHGDAACDWEREGEAAVDFDNNTNQEQQGINKAEKYNSTQKFNVDDNTTKKVLYRLCEHFRRLAGMPNLAEYKKGIAYAYKYTKKLADGLGAPSEPMKPIMGGNKSEE